MPVDRSLRKVMVIGSGPIIIGQAAEFDYSGTQACRSLKEEGLEVTLINSNPATIMTDPETADQIYIEPLTVEFAERVIAREKPDGLLPTLGGQTGLNLATEIALRGILEKHNVRLLGTPLSAIQAAEDRERFRDLMREIGEPVPESWIVESAGELRKVAEIAPYPVIVRPAYTLGGTGGGVAHNPEELILIGERGLQLSMRHQILVERSLIGWKEIEYEVMRDGADNAIVVCNMENLDPMGVHTGDSIVAAPSQTLTDFEYQLLRTASLKIIRSLGIQGGCNVQLALNPNGSDYFIIEVNPRVSRSSALASKATGYPIARIAAKIAIGMTLDEIRNPITHTSAAFEPALDYVVVKIPRFPFDKFPTGDRRLGTQMKATGEVMAMDRTFEGALMKAVRGLEVGVSDLRYLKAGRMSPMELENAVQTPSDERLFFVAEAFRRSWLVEEVQGLSNIDPWFLQKIRNLIEMERALLSQSESLRKLFLSQMNLFADETIALLRRAKEMNFPDRFFATITGLPELKVREARKRAGIVPAYKMVDTCAGEFEAFTPYFYSTYHGSHDRPAPKKPRKALVLGSGPIRIGQGIEFDYSAVHAARALKKADCYAMILNNNPETVSTDFDISDALYFDPVTLEDVLNLLEYEAGEINDWREIGVIVQFGGQTAINLARSLQGAGATILGTTPDAIDLAEDRDQFERLLSELQIPKPPGRAVTNLDQALAVAEQIGYPVLARPSYVLGGRAMEIARSRAELESYWSSAVLAMPGAPVLVDRYVEGQEAEVDVIGDGERFLIPGIMEHIERAGVHSGDSMTVIPPQTLSESVQRKIIDYSLRVARAMKLNGMMNIQYVLEGDEAYMIEVNPRASRTVPYLSKVTGTPMVEWAVKAQLGIPLPDNVPFIQAYSGRQPIAVKAPVFSALKLAQVEVALGPEMKSTGEVMGIDWTYPAALYKAILGSGIGIPRKGSALFTLADQDKPEGVRLAAEFHKRGFRLFATRGTARAFQRAGIPVIELPKIGHGSPDLLTYVVEKRVQLLINTPSADRRAELEALQIRRASVESGIPCLTSLDTARALLMAMDAQEELECLPMTEFTRGIAPSRV